LKIKSERGTPSKKTKAVEKSAFEPSAVLNSEKELDSKVDEQVGEEE